MFSLLLISLVVASFARDVEESMTPAEMIAHWGYLVESHDVFTADGYILNMLRIPHGRFSKNNSSCNRPPILLVHGLLTDCAEFVMNPPESSAGMILADAGFDVFLLNVRGTTHSQRHVNLTKNDRDFWKFTVDDMGKFDTPAAIDKALSLNGASALYYVVHSQGTTISFLMLAERPEYNNKVRALLQLCPATTVKWSRGLASILTWIADTFKITYTTVLGSHELGFHIPWLLGGAAKIGCPILGHELCRDLDFFVGGPPTKTFNWTRMPVYAANILVSTSTWNILHWGQNGWRNAVYHFDASPVDNMRRYGQITAPPYNFSNIDTDVYLFWSRNDWLTAPEDTIRWLIPKMRRGVIKGAFEIAEYNHIDFGLASDVGERIFSKIIAIARRDESNYCIE